MRVERTRVGQQVAVEAGVGAQLFGTVTASEPTLRLLFLVLVPPEVLRQRFAARDRCAAGGRAVREAQRAAERLQATVQAERLDLWRWAKECVFSFLHFCSAARKHADAA